MFSIWNKTLLVGSISTVKQMFMAPGAPIPYIPRCFYSRDRYAIKHWSTTKYNAIRVWKTKSLLDIWYDDASTSGDFIAAIDYCLNSDHVKIEYMYLNDAESTSREPLLDDATSMELNGAMITFAKELAKRENKPRIVKDVHQNLRLFQKYYEPEGFAVTGRRCSDNPYWMEAELLVDIEETKSKYYQQKMSYLEENSCIKTPSSCNSSSDSTPFGRVVIQNNLETEYFMDLEKMSKRENKS